MDRFFNIKYWATHGDGKFSRFYITEESTGEYLGEIYAGEVKKWNNFQGAIALLRSEKHPEYSQMCYVHRKDEDGEIVITCIKVVDENGNHIFVKNDNTQFNDCIFCSYDKHYDYTTNTNISYITFFNNAGI